jgi:deoxynucleoside triphosphate triphosphohydrolase SAMHD1
MSQRKQKSLSGVFLSPQKKQRGSASLESTPAQSVVQVMSPTSSAKNSPTKQRKRSGTKSKETTVNDSVHGNIVIDELCLQILNTKEFQRLRKLKQLGTCDYVYHCATHTRFEHSIGVSYFAGKLADNLNKNQPLLGITSTDIRCVKIAGLCHDLGHGPFSHVFDGVFIPRIDPSTKWRHEDGSADMLRYILSKNCIDISLYGLTSLDLLFIEEMIRGTKEAQRCGRSREKFFLYDIVSNSRSGLDVDKLDYFLRDMKYTNASSSTCNFDRFIELGRVYAAEPISSNLGSIVVTDSSNGTGEENKHYMICYPEKMIKEALDLFRVRFTLHQLIYQHTSVKKIEFMVITFYFH